MRSSAPRGNTRDDVLRVAAAQFRKAGYEATTMAVIAGDLGISPQALYWHFRSKDEILHAYLLRALEETIEVFGSAANAAGSNTERLAAIVRAHVHLEIEGGFGQGYGPAYDTTVLTGNLPSEGREELRQLHRKALDFYRKILTDGVKSGEFRTLDVRTTAFAISGMCTAVQTWFRPDRTVTADNLAEQYAEFALAIVAPKSRGKNR